MVIYIHIPFCEKKCNYCAFYSLAGCNDDIKEKYTSALIKQISAFSICQAETVCIGGGTPPVLGRNRLIGLIEYVSEKFNIGNSTEFTVEINPKTVNRQYLRELKNAGVNRLSIGVQSLCDRELELLGRIHTASEALGTIYDAREEGFENISADIIFAQPFQTPSSVSRTLDTLIDTGITHLSAYSLQLEEGTPLWKERGRLSFPDEDEEEEMYGLICQAARSAGFEHYEISSFGKKDYHSRHNSAYWSGKEYMGFGAAAHSYIENKRFKAVSDVERYISLSDKYDPFAPTDFASASALSDDELREEKIMLSLRTFAGVPIDMIDAGKALDFASAGFGSIKNGSFILNDKGFRVSNFIISELI